MKTYKTRQTQNIYDLALQLYGNEEAAVRLLSDNPTLDFNTDIPSGTSVIYDEGINDFTTFLRNNKIDIATNDPNKENGNAFNDDFNNDFN